ncbi:MAG: hypothetical protein NXI08_07040 [bacterium]|nr:hypothetical protein [bacterium]
MKISTILALTAFWISQVSCFNFGDCFLQIPNESAQTEIHEIIASSNFSNFLIVRRTKLDRGDSAFPFHGDLHNFKYTIDGKFATFFSYEKPIGNRVIRYGPSQTSFSKELGPLNSITGDISPTNDLNAFVESVSITKNLPHLNNAEVYLTHYSILIKDLFTSTLDTLNIGYKPVLIDSMSVRSIYLENLQFDPSGNLLTLSATIDSDIGFTEVHSRWGYYGIPKKIINKSLIRIKTSNEIDTLYHFSEEIDSLSNKFFDLSYHYNTSYKVTQHGIFVKKDDSVYRLDTERKELSEPLYTGELPLHLSPDGKYILTNTHLINLDTNESLDLHITFKGYHSGYLSNTNIVFVNKNNNGIAIFDLQSLEMVTEISISQLPEFQNLELTEYTTKYITEPIFNDDNKLVFMHVRHTRLQDPNYDCYD